MTEHWHVKARPARMEGRFEFPDYERTRAFLERAADVSREESLYPDMSFGRSPAHTGRACNAHGVHAAAHKEVFHMGDLADHKGIVRGEAFSRDLKMADLGLLQGGKAVKPALHEGF